MFGLEPLKLGISVGSVTHKASEWVHDANVSEKAWDTVQRVKDADPVARVTQVSRDAVAGAVEAASSHSR